MTLYRVKWTGAGGGWTGRVFTSRLSAEQMAAWKIEDGRAVLVQTAEVEWSEPRDPEEVFV